LKVTLPAPAPLVALPMPAFTFVLVFIGVLLLKLLHALNWWTGGDSRFQICLGSHPFAPRVLDSRISLRGTTVAVANSAWCAWASFDVRSNFHSLAPFFDIRSTLIRGASGSARIEWYSGFHVRLGFHWLAPFFFKSFHSSGPSSL
jgi:hypothetical protein